MGEKIELKHEFYKSLVTGIVAGIITGLTILLGVRSAYIDIALEQALLEREHHATIIERKMLREQALNMQKEKRVLEEKYYLLLENYKLLQKSPGIVLN